MTKLLCAYTNWLYRKLAQLVAFFRNIQIAHSKLSLWKLRILINLLLLYQINTLSAQVPSPTLKHFTTEDGLPSSQVYQAMQDSDGYLWFATDRGVTRFNGYEFKTYSTEDGLSDNVVFRLFQDFKKRIWMISFSGRIYIFENNKISAFKYNSKIAPTLKGNYQLEIAVDSSENVYIGGNSGLFKIDPIGTITKLFDFKNDSIFKLMIFENKDLQALIAIGNYSKNNKSCVLYHIKYKVKEAFPLYDSAFGRLSSIRRKNNSLLWSIGTNLYQLNENSYTKLVTFSDEIIKLYEDSHSNLWVCTTKGLYQYYKENDYQESYKYLKESYISNIIQDTEKGLWVTTIDDGVYYLVTDKIKNYIGDSKTNAALSLTTDHTFVYAGYFSGEIAKSNTKEIQKLVKSTKDKLIYQIYYDSLTSRLYFTGDTMRYLQDGKLFTLEKRSKKSNSGPAGFVKNKLGLFSGHNWAIYKIEEDSIQELLVVNTRINSMYSNESNELLLGCIDGGYKYDPKNKKITLIHSSLKDIRVNSINSIQGSLVFATQGNGVMIMLHDSTFFQIGKTEGLCSNVINKILVSGNSIWCSSNSGISRIECEDILSKKYTISNLSTKEGLLSNEINHILVFKDTVWVASKKGISFFYINEDLKNHVPPKVSFNSFKVNNIDTSVQTGYELNYKENTIGIGFESPLFKSDGKQLYKYLLTNETDTITGTTTMREVEFLSLNPGNYTFLVSAKNNSGIWSSQPVSLSFSIMAPWWETAWFRISILLILGVIGFLIYKLRIRKLEEKFKLEKQHATLQLTSLKAQMNPHFIFNVMSSIRSFMQNNDSKAAEKYLTSFAKLVRYTLDNTEIQEVSLAEELQAVENYVLLERQRFEVGFDFEIHCDEKIDTEELMMPALLLQPFVENAIKHGIERLDEKGRITIAVKQIGDIVQVAIEDNGLGRAQSSGWNALNRGKHTSFGSKIAFQRVSAFNTAYNRNIQIIVVDLTDTNNSPRGTRIDIVLQ
ncbi:MAG: histidine kinase [Bacteroidia bacterium]|nr:histidine kinase [Bacteroidia bacterium]